MRFCVGAFFFNFLTLKLFDFSAKADRAKMICLFLSFFVAVKKTRIIPDENG